MAGSPNSPSLYQDQKPIQMNNAHFLVKTSDNHSFLYPEGFVFSGYPKTKTEIFCLFKFFEKKKEEKNKLPIMLSLLILCCGRLMDISPKQVLSGMRSITPNQPHYTTNKITVLSPSLSAIPPLNSSSTNTQPALIFQFHSIPRRRHKSHGSGA